MTPEMDRGIPSTLAVHMGKDGFPAIYAAPNMTPSLSDVFATLQAYRASAAHIGHVKEALKPILRIARDTVCFTQEDDLTEVRKDILSALTSSQRTLLDEYGATVTVYSADRWNNEIRGKIDTRESYGTRQICVIDPKLLRLVDYKKLSKGTPAQFFHLYRQDWASNTTISGIPTTLSYLYSSQAARYEHTWGSKVPRPAARTIMIAAMYTMAQHAQTTA